MQCVVIGQPTPNMLPAREHWHPKAQQLSHGLAAQGQGAMMSLDSTVGQYLSPYAGIGMDHLAMW